MPPALPSGGDDVSALVVDPGYDTFRIGNCQEDFPRRCLPSFLVDIDHTTDTPNNRLASWSATCPTSWPAGWPTTNYCPTSWPASCSTAAQQAGQQAGWTPYRLNSHFHEKRLLLHTNRDQNWDIDPFVFSTLLRLGVEGDEIHSDGLTGVESRNYVRKCGGLELDINQHPILVSEPTCECKQYRDAVLEVLFEEYSVPAAFLAKRAALTSFSVGRASSLVVDIGASSTTVSAVYDGIALQSSIKDSLVGGNALDIQLAEILHKDGHGFFAPRRDKFGEHCMLAVAREMREQFCSLAGSLGGLGSGTGNLSGNGLGYRLPDGTRVEAGKWVGLPEVLVRPEEATVAEFNGFGGLTNMVSDCIMQSDVDIRKELLSSIIISGGCSLTPGLAEALYSGLQNKFNVKVKLVNSNSFIEKRFSTWLGGSILSSLGRFQQLWISKAEYQEHGSIIAYRRCH